MVHKCLQCLFSSSWAPRLLNVKDPPNRCALVLVLQFNDILIQDPQSEKIFVVGYDLVENFIIVSIVSGERIV